jgi:ubiquinone/menaquinone biosynthesis C-methylase UbiE
MAFAEMTSELEYTGERMVPEKADLRTFWEHIYRYRFASAMGKGKRVLDIACGEGYGTAALRDSGASKVLGVDVSAEACAHATMKYQIEARVGDAQNIPVENKSIDLVVSFETVEHLAKPELFVEECARVLTPEGRAVISTPNRDVYRQSAPGNPYHLNELTEAEFTRLLRTRFSKIELFTQCLRSTAWWSIRTLASERCHWHSIRGFGRLQRFLQTVVCREIRDPAALKSARQDPVKAILSPPRSHCEFINPFAIRGHRPGSQDEPIYFIAVASI